jgi:hypothetical protein
MALSFKGTIVHLIPTARSFVLADSDGQLVAVHSTNRHLKVGKLATIKATPLADGTYEATNVTFTGHTKIALLHGTVTFVSKTSRYFVISGSGTSIDISTGARNVKRPPFGRSVTVLVGISQGILFQQSIRSLESKPGIVCVEGQFIGLTTVKVDGKPQLELEITTTDQSQSTLGREVFPLSDSQSESLTSAVASGTHVLKICGRHETQVGSLDGKPTGLWNKLTSGYADSDSPVKLF